MSNIIPRHVYRAVESRLHTYDETVKEVEQWRLSVQSAPPHEEQIHGKGYHADPTARAGINLACPPKNIADDIKWIELIDDARDYCRRTGKERLFEVWYGQPRQSVTAAARKIPAHMNTVINWRNDVVTYVAVRALNLNLIKL